MPITSKGFLKIQKKRGKTGNDNFSPFSLFFFLTFHVWTPHVSRLKHFFSFKWVETWGARKQYELQFSRVLPPHDSLCCLSARVIQATAHNSFSTCTQTRQISNFNFSLVVQSKRQACIFTVVVEEQKDRLCMFVRTRSYSVWSVSLICFTTSKDI